jgi:5-amino-6-(5-phosphoribosylamino)uracil reductase/diaminohydroxyphosphoribosylaminopyrimidine deaminase/5-amino-6-(5-phosphoribosylamino)uracil reductase
VSSSLHVTLHFAQTLDGRIAAKDGSSRWIGGTESLRLAHRLRAEHEAVMVGVGTVVADDPQLTVRLVPGRSPRRVVVDSTLRLPLDCRAVRAGALVGTTNRAPEERRRVLTEQGCEVVVVGQDENGHVDLAELLAALAGRGIGSVLVEGGSRLITSILARRLADRIVVCIAPKILGTGIEAVGDLHIATLGAALAISQLDVTKLEQDLIVDGRLASD